MKRTYGGRRGAGTGALDYRELLQSVDSSSTIFDALSIKNLKQLKRDTSSSYQTWYNQRTARKRVVNRARKRETLLTSDHNCAPPPAESCLTPDKSLRVNRAPDSFDQLWECHGDDSLHVRKDIDLFDQLLSSSPREHSLKYQNNATDTCLNLSSEENPNILEHHHSTKSNTTYKESNLHGSSDLHKYNLLVEGKKPDEILSNSIKNVVNNASFLRAIVNRDLSKVTLTKPRRSNIQNHNSTPVKQIEPLTSTPYMKTKHNKYSMNVSPIQNKSVKPPEISLATTNPVWESHSRNSIINKGDASNICVDITHADILHESEDVIISKKNFEASITRNKLEHTNNSIISVHSDFTGEAFLGFTNVPGSHSSQEHNGKDLIKCIDNVIDKISNSDDNIKNENELPIVCSALLTNYNLSFESASKYSNSSRDSQSCTSSSIYNTICSTDKSAQQELEDYKHAEPRVFIERLRDSLLFKHYQFTNHHESSNSSSCLDEGKMQHLSDNDDLDQQSVTSNILKIGLTGLFKEANDDCELETSNLSKGSDNEAHTSSNFKRKSSNKISSLNADYSVFKANMDEVRESISISSESNCSASQNNTGSFSSESAENSNSSTNSSSIKRYQRTKIKNTAQGMTSFVTTRRRNVIDDSVLIILDDSLNSSVLESNSNMVDELNPQDLGADINSAVDTSNKIREPILIEAQSEIKTELGSIDQVESQCVFNKSNNGTQSSVLELGGDVKPDSNLPGHHIRQSIVLQPGKKWERSLSLYRRQTINQNLTVHEETTQENVLANKRKYNENQCHQSAQSQKGTAYFNESVCGRKNRVLRDLRRSTIRIVKEAAAVRASFSASPLLEDDIGFLSEDCDDTLAELSKLSISDSALDITVLEKRTEERLTSARDVVLRRCNQTDVLPFHECYPDSVLKNCRKIGEGVYGEVFLYRGQDGRGRVMKVVPVEGALLVNGEHQKTFQEVISEVVIAMELSALRAPIEDIERHCDDERDNSGLDLSCVENATDTFNEVLAVRCVYGAYPARLLDLWELYDESKGSENDNPVLLPPDQLYMVLELANAGQDLESYQFNSAEQAYALFYQVAFALAVGEEAYQLEHRDLHWGNVLIQPTDQKFARYVLHGRMHSVPRCGVAATIIDYTLSRVTLPIAGGEQATVYNDLGADEGLFHAVGDYQFDIYRLMRDKTGNDWKKFEPYTNILWLHYTVDKMITALRYKRTNTKIHKHYIAKLKGIRNCLLDYTSAAHFVLADTQI